MSCWRPDDVLRHVAAIMVQAVISLVFLSASSGAASALVVKRDMGGPVSERIALIRDLSARQVEVRIEGTCVSACTLLLGVPTACVSPNASLGFHGPSTRHRGLPLVREEFERVSAQMASFYPPKISRWFMETARMKTGNYIVISGNQAIAMGARPCD